MASRARAFSLKYMSMAVRHLKPEAILKQHFDATPYSPAFFPFVSDKDPGRKVSAYKGFCYN